MALLILSFDFLRKGGLLFIFLDSPLSHSHLPFFTRQQTIVKLISLLGISLQGPRCRLFWRHAAQRYVFR